MFSRIDEIAVDFDLRCRVHDIPYRFIAVTSYIVDTESEQHMFDGHLVFGQGPCLIRADDIDRSERFYGRQLLDERFVFC